MLTKSPSGSLCPYYYKGGELHPLKYGSYHNDMDALLTVIDAEEDFILSSYGSRNIWIDLYETKLTPAMTERLARHIHAITPKISKLSLVGCSCQTYSAIIAYLKARKNPLASQIPRFRDPEDAKDWLVGRRSSYLLYKCR